LSSLGIIDLQGRAVLALGTGTWNVTDTLRVARTGFDLNLRVASDFPLTSTLTLTPSFAISGGHTVDSYNYTGTYAPGASPTFVSNQIDEKVRTTSFGGDFTAGLTWQAMSGVSINLSGRAGVVWQRNRLEGTSCVANGVFGAGCSFGSFVPNFVSNSTASDSRSHVGFRGGAALSGSLDMTFAVLTVGGFFLYDSAVAGVQNPAETALLFQGTQTGQRAQIRYDDGFRYGAVVTLRVPLLIM
jgi:hypothetical protein